MPADINNTWSGCRMASALCMGALSNTTTSPWTSTPDWTRSIINIKKSNASLARSPCLMWTWMGGEPTDRDVTRDTLMVSDKLNSDTAVIGSPRAETPRRRTRSQHSNNKIYVMSCHAGSCDVLLCPVLSYPCCVGLCCLVSCCVVLCWLQLPLLENDASSMNLIRSIGMVLILTRYCP